VTDLIDEFFKYLGSEHEHPTWLKVRTRRKAAQSHRLLSDIIPSDHPLILAKRAQGTWLLWVVCIVRLEFD
jgi:hypothetical protein